MGSSQPSEEVTVSVDGITVVKRFEEDEFPVPAIAFEFHSGRDEPVTVRLRDAVPDGVAVEDLGFHPEYGSEYWTVDDGGISFERELGAGAEYTTVYGIRATDTEDIEQFLVEPTIEAVDPPLPDSAGDGDAAAPEVDVVPGDQEAVKEAIAGDGTVPGLEEEDADDDEAETLDLEEPAAEANDEADSSGDEAGEDADAPEDESVPEGDADAAAAADTRLVDDGEETAGQPDDEGDETAGDEPEETTGGEPQPAIRETPTGAAASRDDDGSLLEALAAEVREGDVPEEDVETLREAFGTTDAVDGTTEARIRQLQRDVADLRAYTDALDEFLDENGTAQQVLEDAREQIDSFETQLAEFEGTVERVEREADEATARSREAEAEVDTLRSDVDEVHDVVADVEDDVEEVGEEVEDVQDDVEDAQEDIEDVAEDVDEVRTGVDDVGDDVEDLEAGLEGVESSVDDLEHRAETFEQELEELREEVQEGDLEGRVEEMESALDDLQEWQTQIKETFGGG